MLKCTKFDFCWGSARGREGKGEGTREEPLRRGGRKVSEGREGSEGMRDP